MSNYKIINGELHDADDELYHYGVLGMKWGIRRYQSADGNLTSEGKKRAKQEYREDNKTAFGLGKNATISGHAAARSMGRTIKLENKLDKQYEKDPDGLKRRTKKLKEKWDASSETTMALTKRYMDNKAKAESHCKKLIDKYGSEAVASIKYKDIKLPKGKYSPNKFRTMNERTTSLTEYAAAGAVTVLGTTAFSMLFGMPVSLVAVPKNTASKASSVERTAYASRLESRKKNR